MDFNTSDIVFDVKLGSQSVKYLTLTNISDGDIAYKVKTTSPRRYCVRPNADILPCGNAIDIELVLQAFESIPDDVSSCRDKFQLLVMPITDTGMKSMPVATLWKSVPVSSAYQAKLRVTMNYLGEGGGANNTTSKSVRRLEETTPGVTDTQLSSFGSQDEPYVTSTPHTGKRAANELTSRALDMSSAPDSLVQRRVAEGDALDAAEALQRQESDTVRSQTRAAASESATATRARSKSRERPEDPFTSSTTTAEASGRIRETTHNAEATTGTSSRWASNQSTVAPHVDDDDDNDTDSNGPELSQEQLERLRERVLAGAAAPQVMLPQLSEPAAQRAAVERAGQLYRLALQKDDEIASVKTELAEARHKLADAKMAVLPAYDVKYEIDENARIPIAQIAMMALISGLLIKMVL